VIQAANEPMADMRDMYIARTTMRREFRLLPQAVRHVAPGDTRSAAVAADPSPSARGVLRL
jgi:hypothetical protein